MTRQEEFYTWLSTIVPPSRLSECLTAVDAIEAYAKKKKIISGSLLDASNAAAIPQIAHLLNSDYFFRRLHKRQLRRIRESTDYLQRFFIETHRKSESAVSTSARKPEGTGGMPATLTEASPPVSPVSAVAREVESAATERDAVNRFAAVCGKPLRVDFTISADYTFTEPDSISYFGDQYLESSWKAAFVRACKLLLDDYPSVFLDQREQADLGPGSKLVFGKTEKSRIEVPVAIGPEFYIETNCDVATMIQNIRRLLDLCRVDYENLLITYTKVGSAFLPGHPTAAHGQAGAEAPISVEPKADRTDSDPVLATLRKNHIEYYDCRNRLGCLWVVGGQELADALRELSVYGIRFTYKPGGGNATSGRDAWWTKDHATATLPLASEEDRDQRQTEDTAAAATDRGDSAVAVLLTGQRFALLREALDQNGIRTLDQLEAIKLWPFMNRRNLYSIGTRQAVLEQVNALLYPPTAIDDSQLFILHVGDCAYRGDTPSRAFLRLCDDFTRRYPLQFRLLVGMRMRDGIAIPVRRIKEGDNLRRLTNLPAYIRKDLSIAEVVQYAEWICRKCGEVPNEIHLTAPSGAAETIQPTATRHAAEATDPTDLGKPAEPVHLKGHKDLAEPQRPASTTEARSIRKPKLSEGSVPNPQAQPVKPRDADPLVKQAEAQILKADCGGMSYGALKRGLGLTMLAVQRLVAAAPSVVDIKGRLIHEKAFVGWEAGAQQLHDILEKLMQKNDGYVSSMQLYEYAKAEMNMFLNDNDMNEERKVYDIARHLFEKVDYHGRHYKFSGKSHISTLEANIASTLDVCRKFATDQGGMFSYMALEDYLQRLRLSVRNLRAQMYVPSKPIFFYYQDGVFMYAESMHIDDTWRHEVRKALETLLSETGGHIILRNLPVAWLEQLPELPGGRAWTPLLLQSVLRCFSKELGARTIAAMSGQTADTLQTMLVTLDSPIQSFGDVVVTWLIDTETERLRFEAEELRRELVDAGIIHGDELYRNMPKALEKDERFAWDASGSCVIIKVR